MKRFALLALSAALTLGIAACSSGGSVASTSPRSMPGMTTNSDLTAMPSGSAPAASGRHDQADVAFATDMIPHHGQAVQMADSALATSRNGDVRPLATAIKAAQDPEIRKMSAWLAGWSQPVPSATMGAMSGMSMPGMVSGADMAALGKVTGAQFDRLWLRMMIRHHTGAVTMAKTELADGRNADAKVLARSIIASQSKEIATMRALLRGM